MIKVYLTENKLAMCKAIQVYADGRPNRYVDFKYRPDGITPDDSDTGCHKSIIARWKAGEQIQEIPWPNEAYPDPDAPLSPEQAAQEAAAHLAESDPVFAARGLETLVRLLIAKGTLAEGEMEASDEYYAERIETRVALRETVAAASISLKG